LFSYPDVVVIYGEPQYHDALADVVLNPKVIVEVLSESTEAFDLGDKFRRFQLWNPTLTDYVLVSQDEPVIEHFTRQPDGSWSYRLTTGLESSVTIASISCTLNLAEVYERITFVADQPAS
jgi:Uma2 family endonuclease